jgi:hypothetical protein
MDCNAQNTLLVKAYTFTAKTLPKQLDTVMAAKKDFKVNCYDDDTLHIRFGSNSFVQAVLTPLGRWSVLIYHNGFTYQDEGNAEHLGLHLPFNQSY